MARPAAVRPAPPFGWYPVRILATNRELATKVEEMERRYDTEFKVIFEVIQKLMAEPKSHPEEGSASPLRPGTYAPVSTLTWYLSIVE
jgi:hypothetical protein